MEPEPKQLGRPTKYPWEEYLTDPEGYECLKGVEFDCEPYSFAMQARRAATKMGIKVGITISNRKVRIVKKDA